MKEFIKGFIAEEDGMGVVEIVIIIAVLVSLGLIFRNTILAFASDMMTKVFNQDTSEQGGTIESGGLF